jgi:DNA-binding GntR family transcriptional regulator
VPHLPARVHEHSDLLEAIRARDPERSRAIMAGHITTFEKEIRAVL